MNVGFVSLGCSKNLLDTEMTIGLFKNNKFNIENEEVPMRRINPKERMFKNRDEEIIYTGDSVPMLILI